MFKVGYIMIKNNRLINMLNGITNKTLLHVLINSKEQFR